MKEFSSIKNISGQRNIKYFTEVDGTLPGRKFNPEIAKNFYETSNFKISNVCCFEIWSVFKRFPPLYHNFAQGVKREENFLIGFQLLKFEQLCSVTLCDTCQRKEKLHPLEKIFKLPQN